MTPLRTLAIVAALGAGLVALGAWYGSSRYDAGRADLLAEQGRAAAHQRALDDKKTAAADEGSAVAIHAGEVKQAASQATTNAVIHTVTRYIRENPAPALCVMPPADPVLRELQAAADRANAAARAVQGTDAR